MLSHYIPQQRLGRQKVQFILISDLSSWWEWAVSITPWLSFNPGERNNSTHWIGGWVGPRASLDARARIIILCPCHGSNPSHPVHRHYTEWAILAHPYSQKLLKTFTILIYMPGKSSFGPPRFLWCDYLFKLLFSISEGKCPWSDDIMAYI
jgi:hypothetical protein